jgi:glycosyltransferase involved in cell wall biosynthesis
MAMRVFWQYRPNETGKGKFTSRLLPELEKLGVKAEFKNWKKCDLTISYTRFRMNSGKLPKVLRVDGLHMMRNQAWRGRDKLIGKDANKADAVIWQSEFCRRILCKILKIRPKREAVIFNGDSPEYYNAVEPFKSPYERNVVMMAKWYNKRGDFRISKRTKEHCKIARDYTLMDDKCCFWIIGNNRHKFFKSDRIKYVGWKEGDELAVYLKMADIYLYVPWFDWCPNSAVEAMCAGCYLVCSNNGGHAEIADGYGRVVKTDSTIKPRIFVDEKPPRADRGAILNALKQYYKDRPKAEVNPKVRIEHVASEYKKIFEKVLK